MWRVCSTDTKAELSRATGAWTCQLIRAELVAEVLVLDLVDIDDDPDDTVVARPRGPFTLNVGTARAPAPDRRSIIDWVVDADVVTMVAGRDADVAWICLSTDECQLVLQSTGAFE